MKRLHCLIIPLIIIHCPLRNCNPFCRNWLRCRNADCSRGICQLDSLNCKGGAFGCKLSDEEAEQVLHLHNYYRQTVASGRTSLGPAANMNVLKYDRELEVLAQCEANSCELKREQCKKTERHPTVGQTMFGEFYNKTITLGGELDFAVFVWYSEKLKVRKDSIGSYRENGGLFHNFAQLIWAKTEYVGCGRTIYNRNQSMVIYCAYAPTGNIEGQSIFESGQTASRCEGVVNGNYTGLCGQSMRVKDLPFYSRPNGVDWYEECAVSESPLGLVSVFLLLLSLGFSLLFDFL